MFMTVEEEFYFCPSDALTSQYPEPYIMKHDSTDVRIQKPSEGQLQGKKYSAYYGKKNVLKGGVANTTSGFNVAFQLWSAGITDSDYLPACKVFEQQDAILQVHFQYIARLPSPPNFKVNGFTNVTDKGFRCDEAAAKYDQTIIRAPLKQIDKQLSPLDGLRTAFIAAGRGDNERMVG